MWQQSNDTGDYLVNEIYGHKSGLQTPLIIYINGPSLPWIHSSRNHNPLRSGVKQINLELDDFKKV